MNDAVEHPAHYGGEANPYEAIKVIEAWDLGFYLGNTVKYVARAGKKTKSETEDLRKARWYLDRRILQLEQDGAESADEPTRDDVEEMLYYYICPLVSEAIADQFISEVLAIIDVAKNRP